MLDSVLVRGVAAGAAATLLGAAAGQGYTASLITWMAIAAVLVSSLRFVLLIGELNFAVAAFFGLGAYTASATTTLWNVPFALSLVAAGLAGLGASSVFGYVTLRVKGPYFLLIGCDPR